MRDVWRLGLAPFAMLYRDAAGAADRRWKWFQRRWARREITFARLQIG